MTNTQDDDFAKQYRKFLQRTCKELNCAFKSDPREVGIDKMLKATIKPLIDAADYVACVANENLDPNTVRALAREMEWVSKHPPNSDNKRFFLEATTVKESLEELLGRWLKDWMKELLKVLNELLKLSSLPTRQDDLVNQPA